METKNKTGEGVIIPDHDIKTARRLLNFEAAPPINPTLGEAGRFKDRRTKSSRMRSLCVAGILPVIALLLFSGCQSPNTMTMLPAQPVAQGPVSLAAGDVIKLSFPGTPEYNQSQKIRPDGKISLPLIGEVQAAGKKIGPFQAELSQLYQPQLQNSEVVVAIDAGAEPVYVSGAVNHPGKVVIDGPMTALEAIMEAGGFAAGSSDPKKVHLIRVENGRHTTHILDLSPALKGRTMTAFYLKPKDMIYVPESLF